MGEYPKHLEFYSEKWPYGPFLRLNIWFRLAKVMLRPWENKQGRFYKWFLNRQKRIYETHSNKQGRFY